MPPHAARGQSASGGDITPSFFHPASPRALRYLFNSPRHRPIHAPGKPKTATRQDGSAEAGDSQGKLQRVCTGAEGTGAPPGLRPRTAGCWLGATLQPLLPHSMCCLQALQAPFQVPRPAQDRGLGDPAAVSNLPVPRPPAAGRALHAAEHAGGAACPTAAQINHPLTWTPPTPPCRLGTMSRRTRTLAATVPVRRLVRRSGHAPSMNQPAACPWAPLSECPCPPPLCHSYPSEVLTTDQRLIQVEALLTQNNRLMVSCPPNPHLRPPCPYHHSGALLCLTGRCCAAYVVPRLPRPA